ncbi:MAG: hypothetical protein FWE69_02780 [Clostridiales bacterium]|nr:hypothetical protein [Clostridiales bacterium]
MNEKLAKRIVSETCSATLQNAIEETSFMVSDFDLLILAYKYAPDYNTRLELLRLIAADTEDEKTRAQAERCIAFEKEKWEMFISAEDNCIFEAKIKDGPTSWEERYIARSFEGAIKKIKSFCAYYEVTFDEQSRFDIEKRKFTNETEIKNFEEDWHGAASYKGDFVLVDVMHDHMSETESLADDCDGKCLDCEQRPCFLNKPPVLPAFLKNMDIVRYKEHDGVTRYGIFFGDMRTDEADDRAYLVSLRCDAFDDRKFQTQEQFYERLFYLHDHIQFPQLDVIAAAELPDDLRENYNIFKRLYDRFKEVSK